MSIEQINVVILGKQFTIGTPENEKETLLRAVELLNQKIKLIQNAGLGMSTDKIAIMAALNLTHDLLKINNSDNKESVLSGSSEESKIKHLLDLCDQALQAN